MQTSIPRSGQPRAIAGMIADNDAVDLVSAFNGEASAKILFGLGVVNPGTERTMKLPAGSGDIFMGVLGWDMAHQPDTGGFDLVSGASGGLLPQAGGEVLRKGRIWVVVDKAVTSITPFSDRGFLRYTADGTTNPQVGAWGKATDSGKNLDLTKVTQFLSDVILAADGVTKIALMEIEAVNKP